MLFSRRSTVFESEDDHPRFQRLDYVRRNTAQFAFRNSRFKLNNDVLSL